MIYMLFERKNEMHLISGNFEKINIAKKRENNYDLLRIVSALAVIIIHVNWFYFEKRAFDYSGDFYYFIESILNIITRFSVPVFVMLSGAFILHNGDNRFFTDFYKKTSYKVFLPAMSVVILYLLIDELIAIFEDQDYVTPIKLLILGNYKNLWFLYMILGLYLLVPFVIRIKETIGNRMFKKIGYLFLLWSIFSQATSNFKCAYDIGVIFAFLSYFILGNIIYEEEKLKKDRKFQKTGLILIMVMVITMAYLARKEGIHYWLFNPYTNFFSPMIAVYAVCMFKLFSKMTIKHTFFISDYTFFIYLIHTGVYEIVFHLPILPQNEFACIALVTGLTFIISFVFAYFYKILWSFIENKFQLKNKWYGFKIWKSDTFMS